jgi:hypothetical protein
MRVPTDRVQDRAALMSRRKSLTWTSALGLLGVTLARGEAAVAAISNTCTHPGYVEATTEVGCFDCPCHGFKASLWPSSGRGTSRLAGRRRGDQLVRRVMHRNRMGDR